MPVLGPHAAETELLLARLAPVPLPSAWLADAEAPACCSTVDDPFVFGALIPFSYISTEHRHQGVRWSLCAKEICFKHRLLGCALGDLLAVRTHCCAFDASGLTSSQPRAHCPVQPSLCARAPQQCPCCAGSSFRAARRCRLTVARAPASR